MYYTFGTEDFDDMSNRFYTDIRNKSNPENTYLQDGKRITKNQYKENEYIHNYKIIKSLDGGRIGDVYLCVETTTNDLCVMKTIKNINSTHKGIQRQIKEFERMRVLNNHPNVMNIRHSFTRNDIPHIIMPYLKGVTENEINYGVTLDDLIHNDYPFEFIDVLLITCQICEGMVHCAGRIKGFIHGDIKPSNIFFEPLDKDEIMINHGLCKYKVIIGDFGVNVKTKGYYVSAQNEPATSEDDIYAFAKTVTEIIPYCVDLQTCGYYISLLASPKEILNEEYGGDIRKNLTFTDLRGVYLNILDYIMRNYFNMPYDFNSEQVLPSTYKGIKAQIIGALDDNSSYLSTPEDRNKYISNLLELHNNPITEDIKFDDIPVRIIILSYIIRATHFNDGKLIEYCLNEIQKIAKDISRPIKYNGVYILSKNLDYDISMTNIVVEILKGNTSLITTLIGLLNPEIVNYNIFDFIWSLISPIAEVPKYRNIVNQYINKMTELYTVYSGNADTSHLAQTITQCYITIRDFKSGLPYSINAYDNNSDDIYIIYNFAVCLYNTGHIIQSMRYFERVYDIYTLYYADYFEKVTENILYMTALSLGFMHDYICLQGICELYFLSHTKNNMNPEIKEKLDYLINVTSRLEEQKTNFNTMFRRIKDDKNQFEPIAVNFIKSFYSNIKENKLPIYDITQRTYLHIFLEMSSQLAWHYLEDLRIDDAIEVCDNILRYDVTNFTAHFINCSCYAKLYQTSKIEEYQKTAIEHCKSAYSYLYSMYPNISGKENEKAKSYEIILQQIYSYLI